LEFYKLVVKFNGIYFLKQCQKCFKFSLKIYLK